MPTQSIKVADSIEAAYEAAYEKGWTDGLPIVPPTPARVEKMLSGTKRSPGEVVGVIPPANGAATIEKIAINAVMAGCLPEYLPVVLAAFQAVLKPEYDLFGVQTTTNPVAPLAIINGPIRKKLDINSGHGCLGPGWRANATIGRAIRLGLVNIGAATPGIGSRSTMGQPARYSFCTGENEEESPWEPLHVEKGYKPEESTVTMAAIEGMTNISEYWSKSVEGILTMIANSMISPGSHNVFAGRPDEGVVIIGSERAQRLGMELSKREVKEFLCQHAVLPLVNVCQELQEDILRMGRAKDGMVPVLTSPDGLTVVVAGGVGPQSLYLSPFRCTVTAPIAD
ncbi:MAG: hypothetical protein ABIH46_08670 [Chloroflexota bacterium]